MYVQQCTGKMDNQSKLYYNHEHNMWQKFKMDLKYPPSPFISVVTKKNDCKHLLHDNVNCISKLIKGWGAFCVFDLLLHYYVHDCNIGIIL